MNSAQKARGRAEGVLREGRKKKGDICHPSGIFNFPTLINVTQSTVPGRGVFAAPRRSSPAPFPSPSRRRPPRALRKQDSSVPARARQNGCRLDLRLRFCDSSAESSPAISAHCFSFSHTPIQKLKYLYHHVGALYILLRYHHFLNEKNNF